MAAEYARDLPGAIPRQLAASDSSATVRSVLPYPDLCAPNKFLDSLLTRSARAPSYREAKGLAQELKSLVKRKEPWDRDLEFQRES